MIVVVGDLHRDLDSLMRSIRRGNIDKATLIQVGDFGAGLRPLDYDKRSVTMLNMALANRSIHLYVVRGNHDDPALFTEDSPLNDSNITFVPDYSVLEADGKRILLVGGALSVDRAHRRKQNMPYFPGEGFVFDKGKLKSQDLSNLWAVVTHVAPSLAPPYQFNDIVLDYARSDPSLLEELKAERGQVDKFLSAVVRVARPQLYIYGHYHSSADITRQKIRFLMLDVGQLLQVA